MNEAYNYRRPTEKAKVSSNIYRESWSNVDIYVIKKLQFLYINDIKSFGYNMNPL